MVTEPRHQCMVYEGAPSQKLPIMAAILQHKLEEGYRCLYLNSIPMVAGMRSTLSAIGIDVAYETAKARIVLSSESVSNNGVFNGQAMLAKLEDTLDQAIMDGYKGLWVTGDITWEFGHERNFSKLLEYEWGLEKLFQRKKELCGICQYHFDTLPKQAMRESLLTHPAIVINETLSRVNPHYLKADQTSQPIKNVDLDEMISTLCNSH